MKTGCVMDCSKQFLFSSLSAEILLKLADVFRVAKKRIETKKKNAFLSFEQFSDKKAKKMAERGGFEPPVEFDPYDGLANRSFRPLRHLSASFGECK